ncbi:hypothetical protein SALWKB2_2051 [Snodgrassella alvi wkB2]|nr:hypothetical protein SALWKB2_2051 [Snodgrassella alvi wkB2]
MDSDGNFSGRFSILYLVCKYINMIFNHKLSLMVSPVHAELT